MLLLRFFGIRVAWKKATMGGNPFIRQKLPSGEKYTMYAINLKNTLLQKLNMNF